MRHHLHLLALAPLSLAFYGCASTGTSTMDTISVIIADAQNAARATCSVVPTAQAIIDIVAVGDPLLTSGTAIAAAICKLVPPPPASLLKKLRRGGPKAIWAPKPVVIDGVTVTFEPAV